MLYLGKDLFFWRTRKLRKITALRCKLMLWTNGIEKITNEIMARQGYRRRCKLHVLYLPLFLSSPLPLGAIGWRLKVEESKSINLSSQLVIVNENIWIRHNTEAILFTYERPIYTYIKSLLLLFQPPAALLLSFKQLNTLFSVPLCHGYIN